LEAEIAVANRDRQVEILQMEVLLYEVFEACFEGCRQCADQHPGRAGY
jgi:hypothetical protein